MSELLLCYLRFLKKANLLKSIRNSTSGELVVSFSMLTVNADQHLVMSQFHKPRDEKRTPVVIAPDLYERWLSADPADAASLMTWGHMPALSASPASRN